MKSSAAAIAGLAVLLGCGMLASPSGSQETPRNAAPPQSPAPAAPAVESFAQMKARMESERGAIEARHKELLAHRYDLADHPAQGVAMSRGKPVQGGVRVKLPAGTSWDALAAMKPEEVRAKNQWPEGFLPLPHPNHPEGGMLFPLRNIGFMPTPLASQH